jgi:hypothetical protein
MGVVAAPVVVGDDDITDLQVSVGRVMPVEVTVTVEGGEKPPPFLLLRFEDARAKQVPAPFVEATATTATESFEVSLPDIQYRLVLPQLPPGLFVKSATLVYPSGGTTSVLQREFVAHQAARLAIVLARR